MDAWINDEFATLDLNDLRLDKRARFLEPELCGGRFDQTDHGALPTAAMPGHRPRPRHSGRRSTVYASSELLASSCQLGAAKLINYQGVFTAYCVCIPQLTPKTTWKPGAGSHLVPNPAH